MAEQLLDKKAVIAQLVRSPHGKLLDYAPVATTAARQDPEFYAHLIAWNHQKGSIRDAKVALPIFTLLIPVSLDPADHLVLQENALAHLADLRPKQFMQATEFAREVKAPTRLVRRLITRYLRDLEADRRAWEKTALQHREFMRTLYGRWHIAPGGAKGSPQDVALMKRDAEQGKFAAVRTLNALPAMEIANAIKRFQIPFLIARGALGARAKETDVMMALVKAMTPVELVTNAKALKKLGVLDVPELRATFEQAIEKAGKRTRKPTGAVLKTTTAAEVLEQDGDVASGKLATKLRVLQEKQLDHLKTVDGDWLILGDASGSMAGAVEVAKQVAGILARLVKGKVHLVFFNTEPRYFDVTGKSYEDIVALTKMVRAAGGTLLGVGLDYLVQRGISVDGIAIISDGAHNYTHEPRFTTAYARYKAKLGNEPTVYFYVTPGESDNLSHELRGAGLQFELFDLRTGGAYSKIDRYSLPNLVQTMRVNRYSLVDEIMETPLRTLDEVLDRTKGLEVLSGRCAVRA
jgi:hypothetical protein